MTVHYRWKTIETGRLELSEGWARPLNRSDRLTEVKITVTERKKFGTLTINMVPLNTGLTVYIKKSFKRLYYLLKSQDAVSYIFSHIILNKGDKHCMISGRYFSFKHDPYLRL